jgi:hypothetical protein
MSQHTNVGLSGRGKSPQLPAFCRTRRPTTAVYGSSLRDLYRLLLLVLVFQLSTLLLVIAGPVAPRPAPAPAPSRSLISAAAGSIPVTPRQIR